MNRVDRNFLTGTFLGMMLVYLSVSNIIPQIKIIIASTYLLFLTISILNKSIQFNQGISIKLCVLGLSIFTTMSLASFDNLGRITFFVEFISGCFIHYVMFLIILEVVNSIQLMTRITRSHKIMTGKKTLLFFSIIILPWIVYFLAFSPAIMTVDSQSQWAQAVGLKPLGEQHPIIYTMFLRFTYQIFPNPSLFIILQLVAGAFLIAKILTAFWKKGFELKYLILLAILYGIYPINGFYMVTLWKDIPFAILFTLFIYYIGKIYVSSGTWLSDSWLNPPLLLLLCFITSEFRKNAFPVVLIVLILFFFFLKKKRIIIMSIIALFISLSIGSSFFKSKILNAEPSPSTSAYAIPLQQIAYTYKYGKVPADQSKFFSEIMPIENWRNSYNKYTVNPIKLNEKFNQSFFSENRSRFVSEWFKTLKNGNLFNFIKAFAFQTATLWRLYTPNDYDGYIVKIEPVPQEFDITNYTRYKISKSNSKSDLRNVYNKYARQMNMYQQKNILSFDKYKEVYISNKENLSKFPFSTLFREKMTKFHTWFMNRGQKVLGKGAFWVIQLLILFTFSLFYIRKKSFLLLVPAILLLCTLFISMPATDFRYIFALSFSLPISLLQLIYINNIELRRKQR